jgi:hypothetical protein
VRGEQDRRTERAQVPHELPRLAPRRRVEARRRLVQEQQLRVPRDGECEVESAALAAGQPPRALSEQVVQADERRRLLDRKRVRVGRAVQLDRLADVGLVEIANDNGRLRGHASEDARGRTGSRSAGRWIGWTHGRADRAIVTA